MTRAGGTCALLLGAVAACRAAPIAADRAASAEAPAAAHRTAFRLADHRVTDLDGDGRGELILVGAAGEVTLWTPDGGPISQMRLPAPDRSLLAVWEATPDAPAPGMLVVLDPAGLRAHDFRPATGLDAVPRPLLAGAQFRLRLGTPRFADVLRDVNGDGRPDLLLPDAESFELWLDRGGGGPLQPDFARVARVRTDVRRERSTEAVALSDRLEDSFFIPYLRFEDVNGDEKEDLMVVTEQLRQFFLLRGDGSLPAEPDVSLDLGVFRDTTPRADVRPGRTLAGSDEATLAMQDLDGDAIPDYVIAHRRKLWVFHGRAASGPQFTEPSAILKTAEDVTAALIAPLDEGSFPDLLLLRIQVPTIGGLLKGLFSNLDIEISATGYFSEKGRTFSRTPDLRNELVVRLPQLMQIMRNPESLVGQFQAASQRFRLSARGDFDGDGNRDTALVTSDQARAELWLSASAQEADPLALKRFLFDGTDQVWTIDRILNGLADLAERQQALLTASRAPDRVIDLGTAAGEEIVLLWGLPSGAGAPDRLLLLSRDAAGGGTGVVRLYGAKE